MGEGSDEVEEVGGGEDPGAEVGRVGDEAGAVDERVVGLDEHVAGGGEEDEGRGARVGLGQPDDGGQVVGGPGVVDGDGAVGLEQVRGAAVVVGEEGSLGVERGEGVGEGDEVVADEPFDILRVGERRWPALGEGGVEELVRVLRSARRRRWGRGRRHRIGAAARVWSSCPKTHSFTLLCSQPSDPPVFCILCQSQADNILACSFFSSSLLQ